MSIFLGPNQPFWDIQVYMIVFCSKMNFEYIFAVTSKTSTCATTATSTDPTSIEKDATKPGEPEKTIVKIL